MHAMELGEDMPSCTYLTGTQLARHLGTESVFQDVLLVLNRLA